MPAEILVTREILAEDTVFILQCLRENAREGRSMHMMDVRNYLANSVTLEFSDYLRFLRKFGYVVLDREQHTLSVSEGAAQVSGAEPPAQLVAQLEDFFADKLREGVVEIQTEEDEKAALGALVGGRPPPPPEDLTPQPGPAPAFDSASVGGAFAAVLGGASAAHHADGVDELIYLRGEQIGQGPLGAVYRARHATLGTEIAVKELRDGAARRIFPNPAELAARLKAELGAQARLRHPAIVAIHDLDLTVPQPFAVLELCGGGNLRDRLQARAGSGLEPSAALRMFGQLVSGLAAAHARGLTHHNLKPENVLFDQFGNAKLGDFGLARLLAVDLGEQNRMVVDTGSMSYLAPELLARGGGVAGASADVYALGILLYEALTGRVPGRRSALPSKAVAGVPAEIDEIFDRMTADDAAERYPHAGAVLEDLEAAFPDGRYGAPGRFALVLASTDAEEATDPGGMSPRAKASEAARPPEPPAAARRAKRP